MQRFPHAGLGITWRLQMRSLQIPECARQLTIADRITTGEPAAMAKPRGQSLVPFTNGFYSFTQRFQALLGHALPRHTDWDHGHVVADAAATSVGMV